MPVVQPKRSATYEEPGGCGLARRAVCCLAPAQHHPQQRSAVPGTPGGSWGSKPPSDILLGLNWMVVRSPGSLLGPCAAHALCPSRGPVGPAVAGPAGRRGLALPPVQYGIAPQFECLRPSQGPGHSPFLPGIHWVAPT